MPAAAEIFRALGALCEPPEPAHARLAAALGLPPPPDAAAFTEVFVFQLVPYAAPYLSPDGMLGGEAGDRVAGFWRALQLRPPAEPDHLAALLGLYAPLGGTMAPSTPCPAVGAPAHLGAHLHRRDGRTPVPVPPGMGAAAAASAPGGNAGAGTTTGGPAAPAGRAGTARSRIEGLPPGAASTGAQRAAHHPQRPRERRLGHRPRHTGRRAGLYAGRPPRAGPHSHLRMADAACRLVG